MTNGSLGQSVRASWKQGEGREFEPLCNHYILQTVAKIYCLDLARNKNKEENFVTL